jgi:hypothetical protein
MCILELVASLICDESCTCEDSEITKHFLFLVTEARSFDTEDGEYAF